MCDCIEKIDKKLKQYNTRLSVAIQGYTQLKVIGPIVATEKIDSRKRGRPKKIVATYCPFCGQKKE